MIEKFQQEGALDVADCDLEFKQFLGLHFARLDFFNLVVVEDHHLGIYKDTGTRSLGIFGHEDAKCERLNLALDIFDLFKFEGEALGVFDFPLLDQPFEGHPAFLHEAFVVANLEVKVDIYILELEGNHNSMLLLVLPGVRFINLICFQLPEFQRVGEIFLGRQGIVYAQVEPVCINICVFLTLNVRKLFFSNCLLSVYTHIFK